MIQYRDVRGLTVGNLHGLTAVELGWRAGVQGGRPEAGRQHVRAQRSLRGQQHHHQVVVARVAAPVDVRGHLGDGQITVADARQSYRQRVDRLIVQISSKRATVSRPGDDL